MNFREIADTIIASSGAEETEVLAMEQDESLTRFANNCVHQNVTERNVQITVRAVIGTKVGIAISNDIRPYSLRQLAARAELYGKARSYLETSIAIKPRLEAYQLLASLMEQLGERERALKALNDALAFAVGRKAKLPKIHTRRWLDRRQGDRRR